MNKKILGLVLATTFSMGAANAATVSFTDTINTQVTNWGPTALSVNQFDSSLGALTSVRIDFSGNVDGTVKVESLDAATATVTSNVRSDLSLDLSSLSISDIILLGVGNTDVRSVGAYDGTLDFGGTSGFGPVSLSGTDLGFLTTSDVTDLGLFTGAGTISFNASATGLSSATGAGNLITQFSTNAGTALKVTYTYNAAPTSNVPEPASLALLVLGFGLMGVTRRNKKA